jgi:hypothetical protein
MTRRETSFVTDGDLIIVKAVLTGPRKTTVGRFVLDTGAVFTTMTHELADWIGYSARDGIRRARVHTAIGSEEGYLLRVAELEALGVAMPSFPVHVFDLGHEGHRRPHRAELLERAQLRDPVGRAADPRREDPAVNEAADRGGEIEPGPAAGVEGRGLHRG